MSGERALALTGADGYLGGRLSAWFASRGSLVVAIVADVRDEAALGRAFANAPRVSAVVHLAGTGEAAATANPREAMDVNGFGAANALAAAAASGAGRFVLFSSFHVYGAVAPGAVITEASTPNPLHPYAISKWAGEQLCRARARDLGVELALLRVANGVGAPAARIPPSPLVFLDLCSQAHAAGALTLRSAGTQRRDFISIADVAEATRRVLECDAGQLRDPVVNVGTGAATAIRDVAAIVQSEHERLYGRRIPLYVPEPERAPDEAFTFCIDKLRSLGFRPTTDLRSEVEQTLRFFEYLRSE